MTRVKIYGRCEVPLCGLSGFFIRQRVHDIPSMGPTTSKTRMCGTCNRSIKAFVRHKSRDAA